MNRDIIRAAREGDLQARELLFEWLDAELLAYFAKNGQRTERVDELIQATLVDILDKFALAPEDPERLRKFVHSFAGMEVLTSKRDQARELDRAAALHRQPLARAESPTEIILGPLVDEQQRQLLHEHAQHLRSAYRRALLHVLDGGDYKSLAATEGILERTAWTHIDRATTLVRRAIARARRTRPEYRSTPAPS